MIVGIHNVTSSQRLIDFAKLIFGLNFSHLVVTKVGGTAAQAGVPEIGRLALKQGKSLIVLPDLKDAITLLSPNAVYLFSPFAEKEIGDPSFSDRDLLVFPGVENGFSKLEQSLGEHVTYRGLRNDLGPVAYASAVLYCTSVIGRK